MDPNPHLLPPAPADAEHAGLPLACYRSEAFAEDLDDVYQQPAVLPAWPAQG